MPRVKRSPPEPSREKGQRSIDPENMFLWRLIPGWLRPAWYDAEMWRKFVLYQPVAVDCRDAITMWLSSLDWEVAPRDSNDRDDLKSEIEYYTDLLECPETPGGTIDFVDILEWGNKDALDLPFGFGMEVGRLGDEPDGRVMWIELLDGGTLFPSLNSTFPVGQFDPINITNTIWFPWYAINRLGVSARPEISRKGWYMPPPEKIYLAMEMLNRGDKYYAQLLLDTPEAGILDLIDMSKESAEEWIKSFKALMTGIDPLKVPVLYEHTQQAKYIPFGRPPSEISYNQVTHKYATLTAAAYGLTLSDIGYPTLGNGGETLAGSIRQERSSRRSGKALMKKKWGYFFNRLLPKSLKFVWIDPDEELSVAMGRARLATSTALGLAIDKRMISPAEGRLQMITDGLMSIAMPEKLLESEMPEQETENPTVGAFGKRPGMLGTQVPPSLGGQGEIRSTVFEDELDLGIERMIDSLKSGDEVFMFNPDVDGIAQEWVELVAEDRSQEVREHLAEYVKHTVPERFADTYAKMQQYLLMQDTDGMEETLSNLRYNLVEDFADEVTKVVE